MIRILISIAIMAVVTYLIPFSAAGVVPETDQVTVHKRFFPYYVPYAVSSALTFPGIFYATGNMAASFRGNGSGPGDGLL